MNITKFGHCCLLVEQNGVRILTDPGAWNDIPNAGHVDAVLISHEHQDHIHIESLKKVLADNREATVYTHEGVKKLLDAGNIPCTLVKDGEQVWVKGVSVQSFGSEHACIHHDIPLVQNTGFYIAGKFFYPGDSFHNPSQPVEVLALPVAGPWMKMEEAVEYAKLVKPKIAFPVHDGMLTTDRRAFSRIIPKNLLEKEKIEFVEILEGETKAF